MTLTSYPELMKLPDRQKLALADALWQAGISDATPIAAKQKKLLDTRWAAYRAGKTKRITLEELGRRLAKS
jgi:putative addiction module component (TIGR02574 family)